MGEKVSQGKIFVVDFQLFIKEIKKRNNILIPKDLMLGLYFKMTLQRKFNKSN